MRKYLATLNAFTFSGSQILLVALFPFLADRLALPLSVVVGSFGLGSALFLVGSPFWAGKSDRFGRVPVLTVGALGLFLSLLLVWGALSFAITGMAAAICLVASRLLYGSFASAIPPVAQSLQADAAGTTPAKGMLLHSWSLNVGRAFSLLLFVFLAQSPEILLLAFLLWILALSILNLVMSFRVPAAVAGSFAFPSRPARFGGIFAVAFIFACFAEALNSSLGGILQFQFGLTGLAASDLTARLLLACALGIVLFQTLIRPLAILSLPADALMGAGTFVLLAGGIILSSAATHFSLGLAVFCLALGFALLPPVYLAELGSAGGDYGKRAGFVTMAHTAGYSAGAGLAALRFHWNFLPLELILTLLALPMFGLFLFFRRSQLRETA